MSQAHSDGELVRTAASGDGAAWDQLVQRYARFIWAIGRSCGLRPADAADVSQVVWLRLVEHLDRLREPDRLKSWLAIVTRNECVRVVRRVGREVATDALGMSLETTDHPVMEGRLVAAERDAVLRQALADLSPRCLELIRLLSAEPKPSYEEVSAMLSMPIGSIGPTRQRCLEFLRRRLADLDAHRDGSSRSFDTDASSEAVVTLRSRTEARSGE